MTIVFRRRILGTTFGDFSTMIFDKDFEPEFLSDFHMICQQIPNLIFGNDFVDFGDLHALTKHFWKGIWT